ncbi:MAG TPA: segregation/condensation protein A [Caproiciproducens sp.]|nr:segregation/condensation protein A [Caproiciproducens sp.]
MEKLSYKLPTFEGPLDLLLYLIAKNKLNIFDIQISELLDQYMEQINAMKEQNMDVASEFLEMAARLVYIKTVSLLPKHEESEMLKQELTGQLIEYRECKLAAQIMAGQFHFDLFVREPETIEFDQTYRRKHTVSELLEAYRNACGRGKRFIPPPAEAFSGIVTHKIVSVASQIISVLRKLWNSRQVKYESLFEDKHERSDLVATFLAVLELVKGKRIRVEENGGTETVILMNGGTKNWKSKSSREQ